MCYKPSIMKWPNIGTVFWATVCASLNVFIECWLSMYKWVSLVHRSLCTKTPTQLVQQYRFMSPLIPFPPQAISVHCKKSISLTQCQLSLLLVNIYKYNYWQKRSMLWHTQKYLGIQQCTGNWQFHVYCTCQICLPSCISHEMGGLCNTLQYFVDSKLASEEIFETCINNLIEEVKKV